MSDKDQIDNLRERVQNMEEAMVKFAHQMENLLNAIRDEVKKAVDKMEELDD